MDQNFWGNKKIIITGHTGFKGAWLSLLLSKLGAKICGISLKPEKESLFNQLSLENIIEEHNIADINDLTAFKDIADKFKPDFVFHLAAQPIVRQSYTLPILTWETNLIGSLKVLEALKNVRKKCVVIIVTTDKVYDNQKSIFGYRENDPLGGSDPYSASKAALEIAINSWKKSFCGNYSHQSSHLSIATVRSGNVLGGGDWALDRIMPDAIRAIRSQKPIIVRNPNSTRPWQHVLEPLSGYLELAKFLYLNSVLDHKFDSFNFGPTIYSNKSVEDLVLEIFKNWNGKLIYENNKADNFHEEKLLHLQIDKAYKILGWKPKWDFSTTIKRTVDWYKKTHLEIISPEKACNQDIEDYITN